MKNILISGCTCSGKTTLANEIYTICNSSVLCEDLYFKDLEDIPRTKLGILYDSANAFHREEFIEDVDELLTRGRVFVPLYSIKDNKRLSKDIPFESANINVFEGLHTIDFLKSVRDTLKIFMDTDIEECLKRRIKRDKKMGINEEVITTYFWNGVFPMYKVYIEKQKDNADIVIRNDGDKECLLKQLTIH